MKSAINPFKCDSKDHLVEEKSPRDQHRYKRDTVSCACTHVDMVSKGR